MKMTNFTVAGNRFECVARLVNGRPVYDLCTVEFGGDGELLIGADYETLKTEVYEMIKELESLVHLWGVGDQLMEFNKENAPKEVETCSEDEPR